MLFRDSECQNDQLQFSRHRFVVLATCERIRAESSALNQEGTLSDTEVKANLASGWLRNGTEVSS